MNLSDFINPMKAHPYIVVGGVVGVLVIIQLRSRKTAAPADTGSGVLTATVDPNAIALQAQNQQNAAAISMASINAQTQQSYIGAQRELGLASIAAAGVQSHDAATVALAQTTAAHDLGVSQTGASIFSTAVQGITANYISQLKANGASNIAYSSSQTGSGSGSSGGGSGGNGPNGSGGWNVDLNSSGKWGTTTNNPAGSAVINTANSQIEQLFNNVLRAGQGINPLETTLMTDGGGSVATPTTPVPVTPHPGTDSGSSAGHTGSHDPIFLNWLNGSPLPTVTDISAAAGSAMGWVGSFTNPNTGFSQAVH